MPDDVQAFFERYRDAFNSLDAAAVAELYAEPSGITQGGVYTHWPNRAPIRDNMAALCELYRGKGFVRAGFEVACFLAQGPQYAMADLRWRIDWSDGAEPWRFNTSYNLVRSDEGWKVQLCTAYSEGQLNTRHRSSCD